MLQGLGVTALASILTNTRLDSKGSSREDSGSEYDPQENEDEDTEQEELDKVLILVLCLSLLCWGFGGVLGEAAHVVSLHCCSVIYHIFSL